MVRVIRIGLTNEQLASARFAVSPLQQLSDALFWLQASGTPGNWLTRRWEVVSPAARSILTDLVDPGTPSVPDFLSPFPHSDRPSVADELASVRATPLEQLLRELPWTLQIGPVQTCYARSRGLTPEVMDRRRKLPSRASVAAYDGDRKALLEPVAVALEEAWGVLLAPCWPRLLTVLETDIQFRLQQIAKGGTRAAVLDLVDGEWDGTMVTVPARIKVDVAARRGAVVLAPSVFLGGRVPLAVLSGPTFHDNYLGYPCRGRAAITGPFATGVSEETESGELDIVGRTRGRVLAALTQPQCGRAVAARLGLSPATVSYHLGRLHRGGLVDRRRVGKEVVYALSDRGRVLARTSA